MAGTLGLLFDQGGRVTANEMENMRSGRLGKSQPFIKTQGSNLNGIPHAAQRQDRAGGGNDIEDKNEKEKRDLERWAQIKKNENRVFLLFVFLLLFFTAYMALLNLYVIVKSEVPRWTIELNVPAGIEYALWMQWEPGGDGHGVDNSMVRPAVLFNGEVIPTAATQARVSSGSMEGEVSVQVGPDTSPSNHRGNLVLQRRNGDNPFGEFYPQEEMVPVKVDVTGGWWNTWFILRDWLVFCLIVIVLAYAFCLYYYPPPRGVLLFRDGNQPRTFRLRCSLLGWLLPWRRSSVALNKIWKKVPINSLSFPGIAYLVFKDRSYPPILWWGSKRGPGYSKRIIPVANERMPIIPLTRKDTLLAASNLEIMRSYIHFVLKSRAKHVVFCFRSKA